ncbi:MAG: oligosaccharide flippase family protein [Acidobacteriaceae bacterium]|nr:oligosaccharide flippase family protein [Acidobacteriaceae bacterium]
MFRPEDFGAFALYATIVMIALPLVSARYEMAIVPAETDDEASGLVLLCCFVALIAGICAILVLQWPLLIRAVGLRALSRWPLIIAIGIVLNGIYQAFIQFETRERRFRAIANSSISQSGGAAAVQVSAGFLRASGALGLIAGQVAGTVLGVVAVHRGARRALLIWNRRNSQRRFAALKGLAWKYRTYPLFLPWGGFVNALAQKIPVILISAYYGPFFLGLYAVADRLLRTPTTLIGQSSAQVLFQKMTEPHIKAKMPRVLPVWAAGMSVLAILPFSMFYIFCRPLFAFALGRQWIEAGTVGAVLIPIYWGALVVSPISTLLIVANRQALLLGIQMLGLGGSLASFWFGHHFSWGALQTLILYSSVQAGVYVIYYGALIATAKSIARRQTEVLPICAV